MKILNFAIDLIHTSTRAIKSRLSHCPSIRLLCCATIISLTHIAPVSADATPTPTIDSVKATNTALISDLTSALENPYTLSTLAIGGTLASTALDIYVTLDNGTVQRYSFTPASADYDKLKLLTTTGNIAIIETTEDNALFKSPDGKFYTYDATKLPTSSYTLTGFTPTTEAEKTAPFVVNIPTQNADNTIEDHYYKVAFKNGGTYGDSSGDTLYYQWTDDGNGNLQLTSGDESNNDISYTYDDTSRTIYQNATDRVLNNTSDTDEINATFVNNHTENSSAANGGVIYNKEKINKLVGDFVGNYAYNHADDTSEVYGGTFSNKGGTINNITGNFIGNYASATQNTYGGAIYNDNTIGNLTGDFIGNYASALENADGGAISNTGIIQNITGNFIGNYTKSSGYYADGGAIYNDNTIGNLTGDFINNYALGPRSVHGGAIYNKNTIDNITGDFIGNYAESNNNNAYGGAIYNSGTNAIITNLTGDFINNYAKGSDTKKSTYADGGAIYNTKNINYITGDFIGNHTEALSNAYGGAIYNSGSITSLEGDFISNYAYGTYAYGGAIFNTAGTISNITGNLTGNHALAKDETNAKALGGAIYNSKIININNTSGNISNNYALSENGLALGGAIYNSGVNADMQIADTTIDSNSATAASTALGGAIYNSKGKLSITNSNITNNYVSATNADSTAQGGAIYNNETGNATITADGSGKSSTIKGNYVQVADGDKDYQAIWVDSGTVTLDAKNSGEINVYDKIEGNASGYNLALTSSYGTGAINFIAGEKYDATDPASAKSEATFEGANVTVSGNTSVNLKYADGEINTYTPKSLTIADGSTVNLELDIKASDNTNDTIATTETSTGTITVSDINFIDNAETDSTKTYQILNAVGNLGLSIADSAKKIVTSLATKSRTFLDSDNMDANVLVTASDQFHKYTQKGDVYNAVEVTSKTKVNDSLKVTFGQIDYDKYEKVDAGAEGDTIALINKSTKHATKNAYLVNDYTATQNMGNTKGTMNLTGLGSTILDLANHSGFVVANEIGTALNLSGLTIKNARKSGDGSVINNSGTANITNTNFENNTTSGSDMLSGGVIYNNGTISNITGEYRNNQASGYLMATGGAIFNNKTIGNINGKFINNSASSITSSAQVAALYSMIDGTIDSISGDFIGNYAKTSYANNTASGGAIFNQGTESLNRIGATGGAITNLGIIGEIINSNFLNNYAQGPSDASVYGGAIYTRKDLKLIADGAGKSSTIKGNYIKRGSYSKDYQAIYVDNASATLTLDAKNDGEFNIYDNIEGANGYKLALTSSADTSAGETAGTINFNAGELYDETDPYKTKSLAKFNGANVTVDGGVVVNLNYADGRNNTYTPKSLTIDDNSTVNLTLDIYTNNTYSDKITTSDTSNGTINITDINFINAATVGTTRTYKILTTTQNLMLALADSAKRIVTGIGATTRTIKDTDTMDADVLITSNDQFHKYTQQGDVYAQVELAKTTTNNDSLKVAYLADYSGYEKVDTGSEGDTLALINQNTVNTVKTANLIGDYTARAPMGQTKGTLTVNGLASGSILDLISKQGFYVGNDSTLNINNVTIKNGYSSNSGGAINLYGGKSDTITGNFINNRAQMFGGAIYAFLGTCTIGTITGDFLENYVANNTSSVAGGAIDINSAKITTITGNFTKNHAESKKITQGGAITNYAGTISTISGNFTENYAKANGSDSSARAEGGAIHNSYATITNITGNFTNNSAISESARAYGGAIFNIGTINSLSGTYSGNHAISYADYARGGAIYLPSGSISDITNSNFLSNYAQGVGTAQGAAIYSTQNIKLTADNYSSTIKGNYVQVASGDKNYQAIYVDNASATLTLDAKNDGEFNIYDNIEGANGYNLALTSSADTSIGETAGTINFNAGEVYDTAAPTVKSLAKFDGANVTIDGVEVNLNYADGTTTNYAPKSLKVNSGTVNLAMDVNLADDGSSDTITTTEASSGTIHISDIQYQNEDDLTANKEIKVIKQADGSTLGLELASNLEVTDTLANLEATVYDDEEYSQKFGAKVIGSTEDGAKDTLRVYAAKNYDTLAIINQSTNEQNRTFQFRTTRDYNATEDLGTTAADTMTVNGLINGNSTINLNNHSGFVVNSGSTLNLNNLTIKNANKIGNGSAIEIDGGNIALNNVDFINNTTTKDGNTSSTFGGAVNIDSNTVVSSITGNYTGNKAISDNKAAYGGAMDLENSIVGEVDAEGNLITKDAEGNLITGIKGNFKNNIAEGHSTTSANAGGALRLGTSKISNLEGDFENNKAINTGNMESDGGALFLNDIEIGTIKGNFTGNIAESYLADDIDTSAEDFTNRSQTVGGAIAIVTNNKIGTIEGDFKNNIAKADNYALGGAILLSSNSNVDTISGNFTNNSAKGNVNTTVQSRSGAIENQGTIGNINGNFENNYAIGGLAAAGAIMNIGNTNLINGDFIGNYVISTLDSGLGGAVFNLGAINSLSGTYSGNHATSYATYVRGGAIYLSNGSIGDIINSNFLGNYAQGKTTAHGGAIFSNKDFKLTADNYSSEIKGNYVETATADVDADGHPIFGNREYQAIYVNNASGTLTLDAKNDGEFNIYDNIDGVDGYNLALTSSADTSIGETAGTINFNAGEVYDTAAPTVKSLAKFDGANVTIDGVEVNLNYADGTTTNYAPNSLKVNSGTVNLAMDVDLAGTGSSDTITTTEASSGTINISDIQYQNRADLTENKEIKVINQTNSSTLKLQLASGLEVTDTLATLGAKVYDNDKYSQDFGAKVVGTKKDTLRVYAKADYDTLAIINQSTNESNRTFEFKTTNDYNVTEALGTTAAGTMTVKGLANGDSTINLNNHSGFVVGSNATLNANDVTFKGINNAEGALIDNAGTTTLTNVTVASNNTAAAIKNTANLNLSGNNTLNSGIVGTNGTTTIATGKTIANAKIDQAIVIAENAELDITADNVSKDINNTGTLALGAGTLNKNINGAGRTKICSRLALGTTARIAGTLDLNNGALSQKDGAYAENTIGSITGNGTLALDVDLAGTKSDKIKTTASSDGTLTIKEIAFQGTTDVAEKVYKILDKTDGSTLSLALAHDINYNAVTKNMGNVEYARSAEYDDLAVSHIADTVTLGDIVYDDVKQDVTTANKHYTNTVTLSGTDSIKVGEYSYDNLQTTTVTNRSTERDLLATLAQKTAGGTRTFNFGATGGTHTATENLGIATAGTLNVNGNTTADSVLDLNTNSKTGFELANNTALKLNNLTVKGNVANVTDANATITLNGVTLNGNINATKAYDLGLSGTTTLNGTVDKANATLTGGTLYFQNNTFANANLTATDGTVDMTAARHYAFKDLTVGSEAAANVILGIDGINKTSNTTITTTSGNGIIKVTGLTWTTALDSANGAGTDWKVQILKGSSSLELALDTALTTPKYLINITTEKRNGEYIADTIGANVASNDTFWSREHYETYQLKHLGSLSTANGAIILAENTQEEVAGSASTTDELTGTKTSMGNTLALWNKSTNFDGQTEKNFTFTSEKPVYTVADDVDLGTMAAGTHNIKGVGLTNATLNLGSKSFALANNTALNLDTLTVNGQLANVTNENATIGLKDVTLNGNIGANTSYGLALSGTTELKGTVDNANATLTGSDSVLKFNANTFANADLTANAGTVDMTTAGNYAFNNLTVGDSAVANVILGIDGSAKKTNTTITATSGSGIINVTDINWTNELSKTSAAGTDWKVQILNSTSGLSLALADALKTPEYLINVTTHQRAGDYVDDVITSDVASNDSFLRRQHYETYQLQHFGSLNTNAGAIVLTENTSSQQEVAGSATMTDDLTGNTQSMGDTLALWNKKDFGATAKNFTFSSAMPTYTVANDVDLGTMAQGVHNIKGNGVADATLDMGSKNFALANTTTLNIDGLKVNGQLANVSNTSAKINLNDTTLNGYIGATTAYDLGLSGTTTLNGTVDKANATLTDGTLYFQNNTFANANLTATSGTVDMTAAGNYAFNNLTVGDSAAANVILGLDGSAKTTDTTITATSGSGIINVADINWTNALSSDSAAGTDWKVQILKGSSSLELALDTALTTPKYLINITTEKRNGAYIADTIGANVASNDTFFERQHYETYQLKHLGSLSTANGAIILAENTQEEVAGSASTTDELTGTKTRIGDTLALWNKSTNFDGQTEKNFTFSSAMPTYTVTADLGTTATGVHNVDGRALSNATLDMNGHTGFVTQDGTTLNISGVTVTNAKDEEGSVVDNANGATTDLTNVTIASNNTAAAIKNAGTLTLNGTNTLNSGIVGTNGTTTVETGKTTANAKLDQAVNVANNATLAVSAGNIAKDVTNNGTVELGNGTLANTINGTGETKISGIVTADASKLNSTTVNNLNTLNLSGTLNKTISGTGTTNVNGTLALGSSAGIAGTLNMNNGTVSLKDNTVNTSVVSLGKVTGTGTLELDVKASDKTADVIAFNTLSDGILNVSLNWLDTLDKTIAQGDWSVKLFDTTPSALTLTLAEESDEYLMSVENAISDTHDEYDTVTSTASADDIFYIRHYNDTTSSVSHYGILALDNGYLKLDETRTVGGETISVKVSEEAQGDTLKLVATLSDDVRNFNFGNEATSTKHYDVTADLGTASAGTLNINGVAKANNVIDLNNHAGFELANATTLNIKNVEVTNGDIANVTNSKADISLENTTLNGDITATTDYDLTLSGNTTLAGTVDNANATLTDGTLSIAEDTFANATLTAENGTTIDMGTAGNYQFANLVAENGSKANISLDTTITTQKGSGVITVADITDFADTDKTSWGTDWNKTILDNGENSNLSLALSDDLTANDFIVARDGVTVDVNYTEDTIKANATFDDTFSKHEYTTTISDQDIYAKLATNDTATGLKVVETRRTEGTSVTEETDTISLGDTLKLWAENDIAEDKSFTSGTTTNYQVADNTIATIKVNGNEVAIKGNAGSNVDLNKATLVLDSTDGKDTHLSLTDITLTGTNDTLIKLGANETVSLNNVTLGSNNTDASVNNLGNIETKGNTTLNTEITGKGKTTITSGTTYAYAAINQAITIADGTLDISADNVGGAVTNEGTLKLASGTLNETVNGNGTTQIAGTVTNTADINQAVDVATNGKFTVKADVNTLTNNGTVTANADNLKGTITNKNVIDIIAGKIDQAINGTGTTMISGNVENNAEINQKIIVADTGKLETSLDKVQDITNNGYVVTDSSLLNKTITGNGTTTFNNDLTIKLGSNIAATQNIIAKGNVTLDETNVTVADADIYGNLAVGNNTFTADNATLHNTVKLNVNSLTDDAKGYKGGQVVVNDTLTLKDNAKVQLTVANNILKNGETTDLAIVTAANQEGTWNDIFEENLRYDIKANKDGTFAITNTKSIADLGLDGNDTNAGTAWEAADFAEDSTQKKVQDILNDLSQHDLNGYKRAVSNIAPTDNQLTVANIIEVHDVINRNIDKSISLFNAGLSSGDKDANNNVWVNTITSTSKQSTTANMTGFNADTNGAIFGVDGKYTDDLRLGLGYAYHNTDVKSPTRNTDIKGHTLFVYGKYQPRSTYLRGLATYNFADYDEATSVQNIGIKSDYDVQSVALEAYTGMDNAFGYKGLTPEVGLKYNHITREDYTDTLGQEIKTKDIDIVTAAANVKYQKLFRHTCSGVYFKPKAFAGMIYDVLSDDSETTVNISNNSYIIKGKKLSPLGFETGLELIFEKDNWEVGVGYDTELRKHYKNQTGNLNIKYHF